MGKYDNIVKSSEIRKLAEEKMYQQALEVLDTLDVNKIKVLTDLSVFAEVYMQTGRYEDAQKLLLKILAKSNSRRVVQQLIKLAIKTDNIEEAEHYYNEYIKIAPRDCDRFILRYRIDRMKGESIQILMESLEKLKEHEYIEKWSYELAKLYHKANMTEKCIRECNDIILWFGEGVIVEKAKMLKAVYVPSPESKREKVIEQMKTKDLSEVTREVNNILKDSKKTAMGNFIDANKDVFQGVSEKEEVLEETLQETVKAFENEPVYTEESKEESESESEAVYMEEPVEEALVHMESYEESYEEESIEPVYTEEPVEFFKAEETEEVTEVGTSYEEEERQVVRPSLYLVESEEESEEEPVEPVLMKQPEEKTQEECEEYKMEDTMNSSANMEKILENCKKIEYNPMATQEGIIGNNQAPVDYEYIYNNEELNTIFAQFFEIGEVREQIAAYLDQALCDHAAYSFALTGGPSEMRVELAKAVAKAVSGFKIYDSSRMAKISAEKLNQLDLESNYMKLKDSLLFIEHAGQLTSETMERLTEMLQELKGHIVIIISEDVQDLVTLFEENPEFSQIFQGVIQLPGLSETELVSMAEKAFLEQEFELEEEARISLETACNQIAVSVSLEEQEERLNELVRDLLECVEERSVREITFLAETLDYDEMTINKIIARDFETLMHKIK